MTLARIIRSKSRRLSENLLFPPWLFGIYDPTPTIEDIERSRASISDQKIVRLGLISRNTEESLEAGARTEVRGNLGVMVISLGNIGYVSRYGIC